MKNKITLTCFSAILFIFLPPGKIHAQAIAPYLFGQNAWMPGTIGGTPYTAHNYNGSLSSHWQDVQDSRCVSVRIGGDAYDCDAPLFTYITGSPTTTQLLTLINDIQTHGGEPIVQIAYGGANTTNGALTSTQAGQLVTDINVTYLSSIQRKVKYWSIGNEPDLYPNTAAQIATYIISFSSAMKAADGSIKIIAPELSWYNTYNTTMSSLLTGGGTYDITGSSAYGYYVDYISFHFYGFDGTQTVRQTVIDKITSSLGLKDNLVALQALLTAADAYHGRTPLQMAITESNINYTNPADTALDKLSANSFLAGQFWAETMAYCMKNSVQFLNFWSVITGSTNLDDIGYLRELNGSKRSTWFHFKMIADNFKGTFSDGTVTPSGSPNYCKSFGSYDGNQIAVLIMNQRATGSSYTYRVRFDNGTVSGSETEKIKIPGPNVAREYTGTINDQSTTLLVFDRYGNISTKTDYAYSVGGWGAPATSCGTAKTYAT
jgi:hypothetical protein